MSFDFLKSKKEEVSLLIDVGNGSCGGALVSFSPDHVPKVLYNIRLPFAVSISQNKLELLGGMEHLLEEMFLNIIKNSDGQKISSGLVSFSSPWFISRTKSIHISEDKTFIITNHFLDDILEKEGQIFKNDLLKEREGEVFMIIDPDVCIDCGVCLPECPIGAIVSSVEESPEWAQVNKDLTPTFKGSPKPTPRPPNDPPKKPTNKLVK